MKEKTDQPMNVVIYALTFGTLVFLAVPVYLRSWGLMAKKQ
jgi:hypothetical protein